MSNLTLKIKTNFSFDKVKRQKQNISKLRDYPKKLNKYENLRLKFSVKKVIGYFNMLSKLPL